MDRRRAVAVTAMLAAVGLVSVRIGFASYEARLAMLTLATGWIVAGAGLLAWQRSPGSRVGALMVLCGAAWFALGFTAVRWPPLANAADALALIYAAILAHAAATHPTGRARRLPLRVAIAITYLAAILPVPRPDVAVAITGMIAILVGGATAWAGRRRPAVAIGAVTAAFLVILAVHLRLPSWLGWSAQVDGRVFMQLLFVAAGVVICAPLVGIAGRIARVDAVTVHLAVSPSRELLGQLGRILDDHDVQLGTWLDPEIGFVDLEGRPIALPAPGSGRVTIELGPTGTDGPVLVCDEATIVDAATRAAIGRALAAAASNARLQASLREQVAAVRTSRHRLLLAGDAERTLIERDLSAGLDPRFDRLIAELHDGPLSGDPTTRSILAELDATRAELAGLVRGAGMPDAALGLPVALAALAARLPVPVDVDVAATDVPPRTAETVLFITSEALANVVKHARPTRAWIRLRPEPDRVRLEVADDGVGGADPALGSGLLGLRDRVEALGGRFAVVSQPGHGTRVVATLPLGSART